MELIKKLHNIMQCVLQECYVHPKIKSSMGKDWNTTNFFSTLFSLRKYQDVSRFLISAAENDLRASLK